jgi:hypothetical protein
MLRRHLDAGDSLELTDEWPRKDRSHLDDRGVPSSVIYADHVVADPH